MLITTLNWVLKCVFTCNHGRTAPKEGKCYCPDCGRGVIFQWVVMRCEACNYRTDSKISLRQLVPSQRCCANCGEQSFYYSYLDDPSYFQLHRARLIIREEADYLQGKHQWGVAAFNSQWADFKAQPLGWQLGELFNQAATLLTSPRQLAPVLITADHTRQTK